MKLTRLMAALAVFLMMTVVAAPAVSAEESKSIDLTAIILEPKPEIAIELNLTLLDFGQLYPGDTSSPQDLKVTNIGLKTLDVTATASDDGAEPLFVPGLLIDGASYNDYGVTLVSDEFDDMQLALHVPDSYASRGEVSGGATFWAEEHSAAQAPVADFSASPLSGVAPLTVQFTDLSTNSPTSWSWDFGDGATSTEQNPSHVYSSIGTYTVSLTACNGVGCDDEVKSAFVTVNEVVLAPVADFSADATYGVMPLTVQFTDLSTNSPTSWSWDFGDGATSSEQSPSHTYTTASTYTVSLTSTNSAGSDDEVKTAYITVNNPVVTPTDWATFQGDNHHTGVTTETVSSNTLLWSANTVGGGMSGLDVAPIVADGVVYEINYQGKVFAYDADDGNALWQRTDLTLASVTFQLSTPVYHDGILYVAINSGAKMGAVVYALNAIDGNTIWSKQVLDGWTVQPNTPVIYDEGKIYFGTWFSNSTAGHYYCLNAASGSTIWDFTATAKSYYWAGAAIIEDYLVFGCDDGTLTSVNKNTGVTSQQISAASVLGISSGMIRSSMTYSATSGMVFFTIQSGYCCGIGFDSSAGTFDASKKWATNIGSGTSTPAVYGGKVYVGYGSAFTSTSSLYCLDETTGATQWTVSVTGGIQSSPVISTYDGEVRIYFTTNAASGMVYCVDDSGNVIWTYTPTQVQYMLQGVAIYDGKLFFGNDSGYIFALGGE